MEQNLFPTDKDKSLLAAFAWWEKRRIAYNLVVGFVGSWIFLFVPLTSAGPLLGAAFYGLMANLFYSLGFFIEMAAKHYFKSDMDFTEKRKTIFVLGLVLSILVTAAIVFMVFSASLTFNIDGKL